MKCKRLIVITGMSCQGKTHIALELNSLRGYYIIHTDWFYHPIGMEGLKCNVGEESKKKNELIKQQIPLLTKTTIIEGSHIGNQKELGIFIRELEFDGEVYCFKVESPNHKEYFAKKHTENTEQVFENIQKWFNEIYNLEEVCLVSSAEEILSLLENKDVCISG